jgi:hypothetical protein
MARIVSRIIAFALAIGSAVALSVSASANGLEAAQWEYYNARYEAAARITLVPCASDVNALAACELRTAALLFQIRAALGSREDKDQAWKECAPCADLLSAFRLALARGQALARARLLEHPTDDEAMFLLGKLSLNYVWLQLGILGHRTGWNEYWEGRRAIETVLSRQPGHVRAVVARGWIDYIVATKMPRGTRWLLGGGNRKRGVLAIGEAARADADFYTQAEARFALWDIQVRERDTPGALATADLLIRDFPENEELARLIETHRSRQSTADTRPAK